MVLHSPRLFTITFAGYAYASDVEAYASWVVHSSWLNSVGMEYGVGAGDVAGAIRLPSPPDLLLQSDLEAFLEREIADGGIPPPSSADDLYVVYLPATASDCSMNGGFHSGFIFHQQLYASALVMDCAPSSLNQIEIGASHEIIEAATDPFPWAYDLLDPRSSWFTPPAAGEVGDLCTGTAWQDSDAGFVAQRIWSNRAAGLGQDPCIPYPWPEHFGVSATPDGRQYAAAGESLTFTLTGWSDGYLVPWSVRPFPVGDFKPGLQLDQTRVANGGQLVLTLSVPPATPAGEVGTTWLYSFADGASGLESLWPITVEVTP